MKKLWIGTGWKMNHLISEAEDYAIKLKSYVSHEQVDFNLFLCVPFTVLNMVCEHLVGANISVGAQNMHWLDRGPATGEISPMMIMDAGATMVEIGHSERREWFGETDESINLKLKAAHKHSITPILCVGETLQDRKYLTNFEKINRQIKIALFGLSPYEVRRSIIAYEPVWAIGDSGVPADPEYVNQMHDHIKQTVSNLFGVENGKEITVIYGGSVNLENALSFITKEHVDGLFIGRSAWNVNNFITLIAHIQQHISEKNLK